MAAPAESARPAAVQTRAPSPSLRPARGKLAAARARRPRPISANAKSASRCLPLALIGAVGGVYMSGGVLSVASMIGFITVFGIATRNGIMLISPIRYLLPQTAACAQFRSAVLRGAVERLLPILMTALGTALALVPLVIAGDKPGNEIQTPMATVILCGLLSATALNMIVVPALFLRFGRSAISK